MSEELTPAERREGVEVLAEFMGFTRRLQFVPLDWPTLRAAIDLEALGAVAMEMIGDEVVLTWLGRDWLVDGWEVDDE